MNVPGDTGPYALQMNYAGSKWWLRHILVNLLGHEGECSKLVSPFFGSGKCEYWLSRVRDITVAGSDSYKPIVNLHHWAKRDVQALANAMRSIWGPLTKAEVVAAMPSFDDSDHTSVEDAAKCWHLLANSYAGKIGSHATHVISPETLRRLEMFKTFKVDVVERDCFSVLAESMAAGTMVYADPPYHFSGNKDFYAVADHSIEWHDKLSSALHKLTVPWICSLNDTPGIRQLYTDCCVLKVRALSRSYHRGTSQATRVDRWELLILGPQSYWQQRDLTSLLEYANVEWL